MTQAPVALDGLDIQFASLRDLIQLADASPHERAFTPALLVTLEQPRGA